MKKIFFAFAAALLMLGCAKEYDDSALKEKIDGVDKQVTAISNRIAQLESTVAAIKSFPDKIIDSYQEVKDEEGNVIGYTIKYVTGEVVTLTLPEPPVDNTPVIGVTYYPDMQTGSLWWYIYYPENDKSYLLAKVNIEDNVSVNEDGHLIVGDKDYGVVRVGYTLEMTEEGLVITFEGSEDPVVIPLAEPFELVVEETVVVTPEMAGTVIEIPYVVNGAKEGTLVDGFADGIYTLEVNMAKSQFEVSVASSGLFDPKGHAAVWAIDPAGRTSIKKITFGGTELANVVPDTEAQFPRSEVPVVAVAEALASEVEVSVTSNLAVELVTEETWIEISDPTKAIKTVRTLALQDNTEATWRFGQIKVVDPNDNKIVYQVLEVAQKPGGEIPTGFYAPEMTDKFFAVEFPESLSQPLDQVTFEGWAYANAGSIGSGLQTFMGIENMMLVRWEGGKLMTVLGKTLSDNGHLSGEVKATYNATYPTDGWHHIATTFNKEGDVILYLDGSVVASAVVKDVVNHGIFLNGTGKENDCPLGRRFYIGAAYDGRTLNGSFSHLRVWNKALTAEEIIASINDKDMTESEGLIANWPMTENTGNILSDLSGNDIYAVSKKNASGNDNIEDVDMTWKEMPLLPTLVFATDFSLSETEIVLDRGEEKTVEVVPVPAEALPIVATWTSSDETVATVQEGKIKAVGVGTAVVSATTFLGEKTVSVTVNAPYAADALCAPYMKENYFRTMGGYGSFDAVTVEWKMKGKDFNNPQVSSVFGREGKWLLRIGDSGIGLNELQLATDHSNWTTGVKFDADKWYHVAVTYSTANTTAQVYVNGAKVAENATFATAAADLTGTNGTDVSWSSLDANNDVKIGASYLDKSLNYSTWSYDVKNNRWFDGQLCEVRLWDVVRTAEEIALNMNDLADASSEHLKAYYKMDVADANAGTGNVIKDYSSAGKDLTADSALSWMEGREDVEVYVDHMVPSETVNAPYAEDFTDGLGKLQAWDQKGIAGKTIWSKSSYSGDNFAKASAYVSGTRYETVSWLFTPAINLSALVKPALSFSHAGNYMKNPADMVSLHVRELDGDWTKVPFTENVTGTNFNWVDNDIDLSAYAGKTIQIAFKYTSDGTSDNTGTYEVKDFSVYDVNSPKFVIAKTAYSVGASETSVKVAVESNQAWTVTPGTGVEATPASGENNAEVTLSFAANTDTENPKNLTATFKCTGFDDVVVTITQAKADAPGVKVIIVDGSSLTSTATTADSEHTFGTVPFVFSAGAKQQTSSGDNKFTNKAILIGKRDAYIYNKTAIPGRITKFELYANKGASARVTVGVQFSNSAIASYDEESANVYTATLSTLDSVYDCSAKLSDDCRYFWYQVTNANNSQVQFKITYVED